MAHKILLADDDQNLLRSLGVRLRAEGFEVLCVQDSYQAVDQARRKWPDVMILDINMPAGDGFTVQDRVEKMVHLKGVPVIYLTGERSERVAQIARAHQAFALIYKPFDTSELLSTIGAALDAPRPCPAL